MGGTDPMYLDKQLQMSGKQKPMMAASKQMKLILYKTWEISAKIIFRRIKTWPKQ